MQHFKMRTQADLRKAGRPSARFQPCASARLLASQVALLLVAHLFSTNVGISADSSYTEYQLKAAYVFNLLRFVEWPSDAPAGPQGKWVIGIVGNSPVGGELALLAGGKRVDGHELSIKKVRETDNLRECHIVFVSASEERHLPSILAALRGSSVLTVADFNRFIERGGMIQFVTDGERIRIDVDLGATSRARLKVSSKLLALAQAVTETVRNERH
jgi:hypothetical protein